MSDTLNLQDLEWGPEHVEASLKQVYQFAVDRAEQAIDWYKQNSRPKKLWAQTLRVVAIVTTALAGIIPLLSQIFITEAGVPRLNPAWASVALALGATALGLDRFFGFSTAWMRFITSELALKARLQKFELEWTQERLSWEGKPPTYDQARAMIRRSTNFADEVSRLVEEETLVWVEEFQNVLRKLDDGRRRPAKELEG